MNVRAEYLLHTPVSHYRHTPQYRAAVSFEFVASRVLTAVTENYTATIFTRNFMAVLLLFQRTATASMSFGIQTKFRTAVWGRKLTAAENKPERVSCRSGTPPPITMGTKFIVYKKPKKNVAVFLKNRNGS